VALRPPFGSSQKGARLTVKLTVPPPTIEKLKTVSLSAAAGGSALPPETYTTVGDYVYVRDIPANLLTGDSLRVDFQLDKAMAPTGADIRELGIIVLSIGLESK
jgi:multidrug efflux pump subunit AcrA (membrane-fusion protein)